MRSPRSEDPVTLAASGPDDAFLTQLIKQSLV